MTENVFQTLTRMYDAEVDGRGMATVTRPDGTGQVVFSEGPDAYSDRRVITGTWRERSDAGQPWEVVYTHLGGTSWADVEALRDALEAMLPEQDGDQAEDADDRCRCGHPECGAC